jgi:phage N-6-adenine-methyltransferase
MSENEIINPAGQATDLTLYDPERHRLTVAAIDFGIEEAKRLKEWPALEEAVDIKIEEQRKFVAWWSATVKRPGGDHSPRTREMPMREAEKLTGMANQRVSDLGKRLTEPDSYRAHLLGTEYRAALLEGADNVRGTGGTGENEWYTPAEYLELARAVLGKIDLDPASSAKAQETVQAKRFFSKDDDGLAKQWRGRVWLNPPYAQPLIASFISKLLDERRAGRVTAAITLTHNYTDTAWFQGLAELADAICFTRGRVRFLDSNGGTAAPTQGQAFAYFGDDVAAFTDAFGDVGFVMVRP